MDLSTSKLSDRWHSMRDAKRVDRLSDENDHLRTELRMTRTQLDRERDRQQDVLDALNRASERKTKVTAKPRGGLIRLIVIGGVAYIFGTKAGHERYEQIRGWSSKMIDRLGERPVDTSSPGMGPKPNPMTESGIRPTKTSSIRTSGPRSA